MRRSRTLRRNRGAALALAAVLLPAVGVFAQTTQPVIPPSLPPTEPPTSQPSTQPGEAPKLEGLLFASRIETAHGADAWRSKPAVQTDIVVTFDNEELLNGSMLYDHHQGRVRIQVENGPVMVFDGATAWIAPVSSTLEWARFHLLTWPYFMAAPFKLRDPGAKLAFEGLKQLDERLCDTRRLTFDDNIGDTPDDWYILYADARTNRLAGMAYIVTYGTPEAEAEKEPHAIVYDGFQKVEGVTLATKWLFYSWSDNEGIKGDPIGEVKLSNITFVTPEEDAFKKPEDAREDALPTP